MKTTEQFDGRNTLSLVLSLTFMGASFLSLFPVDAHSQDLPANVVIQWNQAALQGVRDSKLGPPMVARALAIVHTCIYDAWAAYDKRALGTQLGSSLRQPERERTLANKNEAISFAAYRASVDLFLLDEKQVFRPLMNTLGYNPDDTSMDTRTPTGVGNVACDAVLQFRHHDGSNQLGDQSASGVPYSDYTGYVAVNPPSPVPPNPALIADPNRWQPLQYFDATNTWVTQSFVGAQWYQVVPFALRSGHEYRDALARSGPAFYGSSAFLEQAEEIVAQSANLTDRQKMIAEYFADGPHSELPPGHWDLFAQFVSARDHHGLDEDVKLFFALTNPIFDAGIVARDAKPFPGFISGHSTFSAAGAAVLRLFTGSDAFGDSVTFPIGSSKIEPGFTPSHAITLRWETFTDAANQAGISRRYGGIHFKAADVTGRAVGQIVGDEVYIKAEHLWSGRQ